MLIECGETNFKALILLFYPIFYLFRKLTIQKIEENFFFDLFRFYLSFLLSSILLLIAKKRSRSTYITKISNNKDINKDIKESAWINPLKESQKLQIKKKIIQKLLFIIILIIIGLITNLFYIIFRLHYNDLDTLSGLKIGKQSIGSMFEIIYFLIFSKLILKNRLYNHHCLSLLIILFNLMLLIFSFVHYFEISLRIFFYYSLYNLLFCLSYILGKKYLNLFYIEPYELMVKIGLISSLILLIYDVLAFLYFGENNVNIHGIILGFKNNLILSNFCFLLFDIILYFLTNLGIWLTIYYFTPFHLIISELISEYLYFTYDFFFGEEKYQILNIILYIIVYIVNSFFSLVFNEIFILNFCSLSYNTKKYIEKREKADIRVSTNSINQSIHSSSE